MLNRRAFITAIGAALGLHGKVKPNTAVLCETISFAGIPYAQRGRVQPRITFEFSSSRRLFCGDLIHLEMKTCRIDQVVWTSMSGEILGPYRYFATQIQSEELTEPAPASQ
jgi:hypothetical protein